MGLATPCGRWADLRTDACSSHSPLSWTRLSGGGAPSEFALRADLLGGIRTVLVQFDEGPRGVFLVADEIDVNPHIGLSVGFVLRRIYGQEGRTIRGLKAHWSP